MRKELRQRLAKEYSYAADKMQQTPELGKKLYYFSVFYGEAQRVLNWEWDRELTLIYFLTQQAYNQMNQTVPNPAAATLPIDWQDVFEQLTQVAFDLATYFEKTATQNNKNDLYQALGWLAEITYSVIGNGAYLREKGHIKA